MISDPAEEGRVVAGVAGPPPSKQVASTQDKSVMHPGKKAHQKSKVTPPVVRD